MSLLIGDKADNLDVLLIFACSCPPGKSLLYADISFQVGDAEDNVGCKGCRLDVVLLPNGGLRNVTDVGGV